MTGSKKTNFSLCFQKKNLQSLSFLGVVVDVRNFPGFGKKIVFEAKDKFFPGI